MRLLSRTSGYSPPKPVVRVARRACITDAGGLLMLFVSHANPLFMASIAWLVACGAHKDQARPLTARDSSAIEAVRRAYVRAWLEDDTAGVLATLDPTAVLLPPGRLPVAGHEAIRAFWWPRDGSRTSIRSFDWTMDELAGTTELAYTRGVSTLGWRYEKDTVRSEQLTRSVSLTILARDRHGQWRILRQMWGPPLR
jgi:ketosteroid isomerase-like protein